jgi:hypothetical protein
LKENSGVPRTKKAMPRKEVNTEVEKVAVHHGRGNTVIKREREGERERERETDSICLGLEGTFSHLSFPGGW